MVSSNEAGSPAWERRKLAVEAGQGGGVLNPWMKGASGMVGGFLNGLSWEVGLQP